jgi:hypothetical protein
VSPVEAAVAVPPSVGSPVSLSPPPGQPPITTTAAIGKTKDERMALRYAIALDRARAMARALDLERGFAHTGASMPEGSKIAATAARFLAAC